MMSGIVRFCTYMEIVPAMCCFHILILHVCPLRVCCEVDKKEPFCYEIDISSCIELSIYMYWDTTGCNLGIPFICVCFHYCI